ncbi:hypothetical protein [Candidatus Thiothrix anitrata]|jgi:hypothetical protein|uniref:Uncharacterized protein n=1 Tax=Candidatus Thiothrix anitrata TaxID=2823902 RepID=A0ABX7X2B8_9GAMM|nr:hypothetical protein [Candidatus Thiothrix anitrata]QTR48928.1 hypothetical protein J8380_11640 [Candidatus Thiothrix anitrata]
MSSSQPSSSPPSSPAVSVRHAILLAIFIYALVAIFLLAFSPKAQASEAETLHAHLLYNVLGRIEYDDGGRFTPVQDATMLQELKAMIATHQLGDGTATAYVRNISRNMLAWAASPTARLLPPQELGSYTLRFVQVDDLKVAVQNFWVKHQDGQREEFQMVLALPAN